MHINIGNTYIYTKKIIR